jgi:hypothetical protein
LIVQVGFAPVGDHFGDFLHRHFAVDTEKLSVTDASKPAAAQRRDLGRYQFLLAPAQARMAGPINALVETDSGFQQLRTEAKYLYDWRQLIPSPLAHRRAQPGEGAFINFFKFSARIFLGNNFDETHRFILETRSIDLTSYY